MGWNLATVKQLAQLLGKSPKTIYNTLDDYPHYRSPQGAIYFKLDEVQEYLCAIKCTPRIASIINTLK